MNTHLNSSAIPDLMSAESAGKGTVPSSMMFGMLLISYNLRTEESVAPTDCTLDTIPYSVNANVLVAP